jgi:pimeloyl-ACP methyl ester carboxylesterase
VFLVPALEHDGATLVYDDAGGDLPPLVLIHGLSSSRLTWDGLLPRLKERFRVLRFDQRGHGESSHADGTYTLAHYVPDAIAFCEDVVCAPATVVGHSLGGVVATVLGRDRPDLVRGVFLEDPPLYRREDPAAPDTGVAAMFPAIRHLLRELRSRGAPLDDYVAMIGNAPAMNGKGQIRDVLGDQGVRAQALTWSRMDPEVFTPAIDRVALVGADPERALPVPAHVLRADPELGAAFTAEDERRFLATNPGASVGLMAGASHAIHDEQAQRFLAELLAFVDRVGG